MKKHGKILMAILALLSVFALFMAGCKPDDSDKNSQGGDDSANSYVNSGGDSDEDDDGYTDIAPSEAVEFIADYAEQFLASENATLNYVGESSLTGKFKSVSDGNGNLKKIAKMNGATKMTYEYLNGEKTFHTEKYYNGSDMFDGSGEKITSENDSGGVLTADGIIYDLKYINGDYYSVIHSNNDGMYLPNYIDQYKRQAAIYLCECAMYIALVTEGSTQSAESTFVGRGILSANMVGEIQAMTIDTSTMQVLYSIWGEDGEVEIKTKYDIGYVKYREGELKVQSRLTPDNEGVTDPAMEGESMTTFTFNYAAGLDEEHFNGIINKTAPQG